VVILNILKESFSTDGVLVPGDMSVSSVPFRPELSGRCTVLGSTGFLNNNYVEI
jgi:hypothetical protein